MNQKVWNLFAETEKVKDMLRAYAKKESLRVYLFSYSQPGFDIWPKINNII